MDVLGPGEVFIEANRQKGEPYYDVILISGSGDTSVATPLSNLLSTHGSFLEVDGKFDTLLVAGGVGARSPQQDPRLLEWLRRGTTSSRRFGSVCTGTLVLAAAGLLNGRRATTHWNWCEELARSFPEVRVEKNPIFVKDGNCYTSAGVTAGIDLALALVEEDLGRDIALRVAQMMVVFLRRPGGQSQFSVTLAAQATERDPLADLLAWLPDHVSKDLSIGSMARRTAMSARNFARVFKESVGTTPAQHLETLRIEASRRLLESTALSHAEIAQRVGFRSTETLRRAFRRRMDVTPGQYRQVFGAAGEARL
jgi:transcriptional regulator GlxA family with amidase domain